MSQVPIPMDKIPLTVTEDEVGVAALTNRPGRFRWHVD